MMFNIGMSEMILIIGVALLVFGPNELPQIIKKVGRGLREVRRASDDLRASISLDDDVKRPPPPVIRAASGIAPRTDADPAPAAAPPAGFDDLGHPLPVVAASKASDAADAGTAAVPTSSEVNRG
jgi:sec-independent protein translocase protein TatB